MRLSKLEMQGFKSFADSTTMLFDTGVTAIVGPNGCGKSNVSDAVRWVLGEQRARMLRGAKMEEVIFQGSSARRAVSLAEVSLFFENDDGGLPIPFREVVITRRLSRSGESEYLMNGAACRLRDIHDMLRGTGLGADAGVVIEAKMIDALLSDRPDDRRELFEEAAGVSLYRDRRRSTERRLEETSQDLARLDDLLTEVQSQVRSLARQRKKAERHSELMSRRFAVDLTLAAREMEAWHQELIDLEGRVDALRRAAPTAAAAVSEAERTRERAHAARLQAEAGRAELSRLATQHRDQVQALRAEIAVSEERQRNALERRRRAEEERREGAVAGERLLSERDQALGERDACAAAVRDAELRLQTALAAEDGARTAVVERRAAVDATERRTRETRDQIRRLELELEASAREAAEVETKKAEVQTDARELQGVAAQLEQEFATAEQYLAAQRAELTGATEALESLRQLARERREQADAAGADRTRLGEQHAALDAKLSALEGLERERVGLAPAAARLLRDRDTFGPGAILGPLSDFVSAGAAGALLVERFLGMTVHAVVVRDCGVGDRVRAWHAETAPGPLLLLPLDAVPEETRGDGDLLSGLDVVPAVARWVRTLLGHVQALDGGTSFVDQRGAVWLPGTVSGPGPLRRRAELFALRAERQASEDALQQAVAVAAAARTALKAAEKGLQVASERADRAQSEERQASERRAAIEHRRTRAARDVTGADEFMSRLSARRAELDEQGTGLRAQLEAAMASLGQGDAAVEATRTAAAEGERLLETARETRAERQVAVAQANAREHVAVDRLERLLAEHSSATSRLTVLEDELSALSDADRRLAEQLEARRTDLGARDATLRDTEQRLLAAEADVQRCDAALEAADRSLEARRREAHERESVLHAAELRFTELAGKRTAIRERLETEWRRPLEDLLNSYEAVDVDDDTLRAEADLLRTEVEKLGPVNPLAIEEHDEELKRFDFLTAQRHDLGEAKTKLQLAIREIDTTARDLFLTTFANVRENFRQIFMTLFGGGECDLRLENPEMPLDCDIEIHASPRGKRTQRIHLLSSGERALVALSLLFGIFLTKPSPFCLLDEVDAPLDDANIGRYVRMLSQFKEKTQFIVITHNPRTTTEAADAVYGVTMQEPGVSSLVSVRMRGSPVDDEPREAAEVPSRGAEAAA